MQQINTEYIDINLLIEDEINYNIHNDKHVKNMSLSVIIALCLYCIYTISPFFRLHCF